MSQCAMLSTRFKKITAVLDFYEKETDLSQFSAQQNQTTLLLQNECLERFTGCVLITVPY